MDVRLCVHAKRKKYSFCVLVESFFGLLIHTPAWFEPTDGASFVKDVSCI